MQTKISKQEAISQVIAAMRQTDQPFYTAIGDIRLSDEYWQKYPEGNVIDSSEEGFAEGFEGTFVGLDVDCLQLMAKDMPRFESFHKLWVYWRNQGYIKAQPLLLDEQNEVPSLKFGNDMFLGRFRGYSFQVSWNCMRESLQVAKCWDPPLQWSMALSHAIEAATNHEEFHTLLRNNVELFDKFMQRTDAYASICCRDFELAKFRACVLSGVPEDKSVLRLILANTAASLLYGHLEFGYSFVSISLQMLEQSVELYIPFPSATELGISPDRVCIYYHQAWERLAIVLLGLQQWSMSTVSLSPENPRLYPNAAVKGACFSASVVQDLSQLYSAIDTTINTLFSSEKEESTHHF